MIKWSKILSILFISFIALFSLTFCYSKLKHIPLISGDNSELSIYEVWHIESFEGGSRNRLSYLKQIALDYEKEHSTQLFMIRQVQASDLENLISQSRPALVSFTEETAKIVLPYLAQLSKEYGVAGHILESAEFNGKLMAIPYIASGYCYILKQSAKDTTLYSGNNSCHTATDFISTQVNNNSSLSSYECYSKFVNSNDIQLLGTFRDVFRVKNLQNLGRFQANFTPFEQATDLIQYLGITNNSKEIQDFLQFIMQDKYQYNLRDLSLFSTKFFNLYTDEVYSKMENALKSIKIPNIFM